MRSAALGAGPACQAAVPAYFYPVPRLGQGHASKHRAQHHDHGHHEFRRGQLAGSGLPGGRRAGAGRRDQGPGLRQYGLRAAPGPAVETDVRHYRAWYNVTGIFLDEAATGSGKHTATTGG